MPVGDSRKEFLLSTVGGQFSLSSAELEVQGLHDSPALNSFLDDGNVTSLCANAQNKGNDVTVTFSNTVSNNCRLISLVFNFVSILILAKSFF